MTRNRGLSYLKQRIDFTGWRTQAKTFDKPEERGSLLVLSWSQSHFTTYRDLEARNSELSPEILTGRSCWIVWGALGPAGGPGARSSHRYHRGALHIQKHTYLAKDMPDVQTPVCLLTICSASTGVAAASTPCASHPSRAHPPSLHPSVASPDWTRQLCFPGISALANFYSAFFRPKQSCWYFFTQRARRIGRYSRGCADAGDALEAARVRATSLRGFCFANQSRVGSPEHMRASIRRGRMCGPFSAGNSSGDGAARIVAQLGPPAN